MPAAVKVILHLGPGRLLIIGILLSLASKEGGEGGREGRGRYHSPHPIFLTKNSLPFVIKNIIGDRTLAGGWLIVCLQSHEVGKGRLRVWRRKFLSAPALLYP